jgi:sterol desaturase/sphingolipid hydroxylase (fatty acid hydroxylase superfamily)
VVVLAKDGFTTTSTFEMSKGLKRSKSILESNFVAWVLENGAVWAAALFIHFYLDSTVRKSFYAHWFQIFLQSAVSLDVVILIQKFYAQIIYSNIPYLNESYRRSAVWNSSAWREWITVHVPARFLASYLMTSYMFNLDEETYLNAVTQPFNPSLFLPKLLAIRIISDFAFYLIHYALHLRYLFSLIHKTHHEHVYTVLETNYHFSVADLVCEGFLPFFTSLQLLTMFFVYLGYPGLGMSRLDIQLCSTYVYWLEIGSHTGKEIPTLSFFPPLSIIYRYFYPDFDSHNVLFHESHHNLVTHNYGINRWTDQLFGTEKLNLKAIPDVSAKAAVQG